MYFPCKQKQNFLPYYNSGVKISKSYKHMQVNRKARQSLVCNDSKERNIYGCQAHMYIYIYLNALVYINIFIHVTFQLL